jgi:hypothetical protein
MCHQVQYVNTQSIYDCQSWYELKKYSTYSLTVSSSESKLPRAMRRAAPGP